MIANFVRTTMAAIAVDHPRVRSAQTAQSERNSKRQRGKKQLPLTIRLGLANHSVNFYPAGTVMIGAPCLSPVSVSVKRNIIKVNSLLEAKSLSSIQYQF